jgi:hypothetical protein
VTVSSINYEQLASGGGTEPPDGLHDAYLMRARLQTGNQDFVVTEWQAGAFYWETLYGFTPQRLQFTQDMLDGLGIDRAKITDDDALEMALADAQGSRYRVRVERNGRFVNTYIEGGSTVQPSAQASFADVPIDTSGLPDVSQPPPTYTGALAGMAAPPPTQPQPALTGAGAGPPTAPDDDLDDIPF